jgi:hypothetical protein
VPKRFLIAIDGILGLENIYWSDGHGFPLFASSVYERTPQIWEADQPLLEEDTIQAFRGTR